MNANDSQHLGRAIGALPPAPQAWVEAAAGLPRARRELDVLLERAQEDSVLRARLIADLESGLAESGLSPAPRLLTEARRRLRALPPA